MAYETEMPSDVIMPRPNTGMEVSRTKDFARNKLQPTLICDPHDGRALHGIHKHMQEIFRS